MIEDDKLVTKTDLPRMVEELSHRIIGCAIEVHRHLGPGLVERVYEDALVYELRHAGMTVVQQAEITIKYKDIVLRGQRIDLMVDDQIIVENKAMTDVPEEHVARLISYLRATDKPLGLLFNFHAPFMRNGIDRLFNPYWSGLKREVPFVRPPSLSSSLRCS